MALNWVHSEKDNTWVAKDKISDHFAVMYELWSDEDDLWYGYYQQWWREVGKGGDEYAGLMLDEFGFKPVAGVQTMKDRVDEWHAQKAYPGLESLYTEYLAENFDGEYQ